MTEPIFLQGICKDYLWGGNRLSFNFFESRKESTDKNFCREAAEASEASLE